MKKVLFIAFFTWAAVAQAATIASNINENGQAGGLHLPTARHLDAGSAYAGVATGTPYRQLYAGIQPIDALRITIRQQQDRRTNFTYPGIDAQIQLTEEGEYIPAAALGYTHFIGQRRFGGEYLVFSKRYWDLDFNLGLGWGRYANGGSLRNPFAQASSRYQDAARDNGYGSTGFGALYRGRRMGLFGSVTYQTPWQPLKLIAEFDRDPYLQEKYEGNLSQRGPFNVGARYAVWDGLAITASVNGLSRAQINLSYALNFQSDANRQLEMTHLRELTPAPLPAPTPELVDLRITQQLAFRQGAEILSIERRHADDDATCIAGEECSRIYLRYRAGDTPPYATYLGRAAYSAAEYAEKDIESITLVPEHNGLVAGSYTIIRRDLSDTTHFAGSPEEIWQSAVMKPPSDDDAPALSELPVQRWHLFTAQRFDMGPYEFGSLLLSRERFLAGGRYEILNGIHIGASGAYESGNNLPYIIAADTHAVRSNINAYTGRLAKIETLYVNVQHEIAPNVHARITGGLLEEMFRGVSAEVLYQPHTARWGIGAEANWLQQRDPNHDFLKTSYHVNSGALSFYYEVLPRDLTVIARAESFLARDHGLSLEFRQEFMNGIRLSLLGTWSNQRDYGGPEDRGHADARMMLHIPLQYEVVDVPIQNNLDANLGSIARDMGQQVNLPMPRLWDATRPISYGPMIRSWQDVLKF